jgi:HD superfamily phosphodiesterase
MIGKIMSKMVAYYAGDVERINHFTKVYGFAKAIGEMEGLDATTLEIVEIAALTHDIGIKVSEEKHQSSAGQYQEIEGPAVAREILGEMELSDVVLERVCYIIGHHHTYHAIEGIDFQIVVEADFLVNIYEEGLRTDAVKSIAEKIFKTKGGIEYLNHMFMN